MQISHIPLLKILQNKVQIPQAGAILQCDSYANHLELAQTYRSRALSLMNCCHSGCGPQVQGSPGYPHFWTTGWKFRNSLNPLRYDNLLEFMELSGTCYTYDYSFTIKETNQDQPNEEIQRASVLNVGFLCTFPVGSGGTTFPTHGRVHLPGSSQGP